MVVNSHRNDQVGLRGLCNLFFFCYPFFYYDFFVKKKTLLVDLLTFVAIKKKKIMM